MPLWKKDDYQFAVYLLTYVYEDVRKKLLGAAPFIF